MLLADGGWHIASAHCRPVSMHQGSTHQQVSNQYSTSHMYVHRMDQYLDGNNALLMKCVL